jgi:antitoxin component of MazEF toxin-antitoxin module
MTHVTVGRWGKKPFALGFPNEIASQAGLCEGEQVEIETQGDAIVVRRSVPRYTLEELFARRSSAKWRALYAGAYDRSPDVGREIVKE